MRFSFSFWAFALSLASSGEGVVETNSTRLPTIVIIKGEGEVVDPGKWTPFPTAAPAVTDAPTGYPTVPTEPPLPQNYIMLGPGEAKICPVGTEDVLLEDCLDAAELLASMKYGFPFYLDEHIGIDVLPCGCFIELTDMGNRIVNYNTCEEQANYISEGYGSCDDGNGEPYLPAYYGRTNNMADCEAACTFLEDCIAYDYTSGKQDNCYLRFASTSIRNMSPSLPNLGKTYDGCGNSCISDVITTNAAPTSMLACGAIKFQDSTCGGATAFATHEERHPVRCCSDVALPGWTKKDTCDVWTETELQGNCYDAATYEEAVAICTDNNGRLCTAEEMLADCTSGTGCFFNKEKCWTSTSATAVDGGLGEGATLYTDDHFLGTAITFASGSYDYPAFIAAGVPNDETSSLKVNPGFEVHLYEHEGFSGWHAVFPAGDYDLNAMIAKGALNDDTSSMIIYAEAECKKKVYAAPQGIPNPATELICKLPNGIAAGVDELDQWSKIYGYGTEAGEDNPSLWASDALSGEFYIMRQCPECADSHKTIVYKRLTPLPAGYDVESLFLNTWSSANNELGVDFNLYSSMTYALADIEPWTYCNYDNTGVGFPRDCGANGAVQYQWHNFVTGQGQQQFAFYLWGGTTAAATYDSSECVASNPASCGCAVVNQMDYRGTVAVTKTGHTCQAWDSQFPHAHEYTSANAPDSGLESNYCRNPNNWHEGAWCYTTDPNVPWSVCDIQDCYVPPFDNDWYKDYPFMPWHLPPWHIVMNINPSDGMNSGWGSEIWYGEDDVGLDINSLTQDYKDATVNWHRSFDCIAIIRHNSDTIDGVKVWEMKDTKTFSQYFNSQTHSAREVVTTGGPLSVFIAEGLIVDNDPILASNGTDNNLAFNWRYGNAGSRIVLTDVGNYNGVLSCDTCDDYATHGLGNDFGADTINGAGSTTNYHDASYIQGACSGASCNVQGTDHGITWSTTQKLGNYAIYVSLKNATTGVCPSFEVDIDNLVPVTQDSTTA